MSYLDCFFQKSDPDPVFFLVSWVQIRFVFSLTKVGYGTGSITPGFAILL